MRSQSERRDTSAWIASARPPSFSTSVPVSTAPTMSMSAIVIAAPSRAKSTAAARPWPDAAPVITATLPSSKGWPRTGPYDTPMAADAVQEHGALFDRRGEMFVPTPLARGPWDPNALHGGAPSALFAFVLGRHDPGPA